MSDIGDSEACDWCGRPGQVEQFDFWHGDRLVLRDPALCSVCSIWLNLPGDVIDAMEEAGINYDEVIPPFHEALMERWAEKIADGRRSPQGPERSIFISQESLDPPHL